jgi:tyrosine-protein kinase Etk/Wzc
MKTVQKDFPMSYQQLNSFDKGLNITTYFFRYLRYWPFFLVSIAICVGVANRYLGFEVPVYTVEAKILINNENTGQNVKQESPQSENAKKVDDEIEILTSRTIMAQVVNDLELWKQYYMVDQKSYVDLYKEAPIKLSILKTLEPLQGQSLKIIVLDRNTFVLKQAHSSITFPFGKQLRSSWGIWKLEPTSELEAYRGKEIEVFLSNSIDVADEYLMKFNAYLTAEKSSVVQLNIKETLPERGADVINGVITAYNLASINYKNKVNRSTLSFLNERLDSIKSELNVLEKRVEKYKSVRGITDLSAESSVYLENVKSNDSRLNDVDLQLQLILGIQKYISSPNNAGNAPSTSGIADPILLNLVDNLIKLESEKNRLLSNTPEMNPIFVPLNRQIAATKKAINASISGIKSSYLTTRKQLQKYNNVFESSIKKLPGQEREFINIKRQQSIKEELYMYLLQKREEAGVTNASKLLDSRIIDQAHYGSPETHNKNFAYALAFIFGLIVPAGVIFSKDALNTRIRNITEVEDAVFAPILGELVHQKSNETMFVLDGSRTMISEQFRILRTKLHQIKGKNDCGKITVLTSGMPGDGKSMICRNLGAVLAAAGSRTIVIDADFRKPQLAQMFNLSNELGLSNYLAGSASIEQVVQPSAVHPGLFIIGTGSELNNPSELLSKKGLAELFDWLRLYFDEILVDTPPVQLVTDALILADYSDVNLYVLRQDHTYRSQFKYLNQLSLEESLKNLHVIFNGVKAQPGEGYEKSYAYDYYAKEAPKARFSLIKRR